MTHGMRCMPAYQIFTIRAEHYRCRSALRNPFHAFVLFPRSSASRPPSRSLSLCMPAIAAPNGSLITLM